MACYPFVAQETGQFAPYFATIALRYACFIAYPWYNASMDKDMPQDSDAQKPGRARGGEARAKALPAKRRSEIGKRGAAACWDPSIRVAEYGDEEHPLLIGGVKVPCYVLEDTERVLSQRGFFDALGITSRGGELARFLPHAHP